MINYICLVFVSPSLTLSYHFPNFPFFLLPCSIFPFPFSPYTLSPFIPPIALPHNLNSLCVYFAWFISSLCCFLPSVKSRIVVYLSLSLFCFFSVSLPMHCLRISRILTPWCNFPVVPQHFWTMQFYCVSQIYFHPKFQNHLFRSSICFWADVYPQGDFFWRKLCCLGSHQQNTCQGDLSARFYFAMGN